MGFTLLADLSLQRFSEALEGANRALGDREDQQVAIANSVSDAISRTRQAAFDSNPFRILAEFPLSPPEFFLVDDVTGARESLREVLLQERIIGLFLLGTCVLLSLLGGMSDEQNASMGSLSGRKEQQDLIFRKTLNPAAEAAFDAGLSPEAVERLQTSTDQLRPAARGRQGGVTAILWLQLVLCIAIDAAGDASLFYPIGEFWDIPFAVFSALVIELFFGWPALAIVAFWEELLPLTDILPTATLGWLLVVVLGRRPKSAAPVSLLAGRLDPDLFAPGARPPTSDSRSFTSPEPWLDSSKARGSWNEPQEQRGR
jgi:hypothetical protein